MESLSVSNAPIGAWLALPFPWRFAVPLFGRADRASFLFRQSRKGEMKIFTWICVLIICGEVAIGESSEWLSGLIFLFFASRIVFFCINDTTNNIFKRALYLMVVPFMVFGSIFLAALDKVKTKTDI